MHKVFLPTDDSDDPLLRLYVINRTTGKVEVAGPKQAQYNERITKAEHQHSYEEAVIACMRTPRFVGFVLMARTHAVPEAPGSTGAGLQRNPTLFFEAGDAEEMRDIDSATYTDSKQRGALNQHVFQLYPRLDKCVEPQYCIHPMLVPEKLDMMGLKVHTPPEPYTSVRVAKRYCTRLPQLAGFSCKRDTQDEIVFYEYIDNNDTDVDAKLMKASESLTGDDVDSARVFYRRSDSACRTTVADRDSVVQWREWWKNRELGPGVRIHPMLAEREVQRRTCVDDTESGLYDYNCFLSTEDTKTAQAYIKEHHGDDAARALALSGPTDVDDDQYLIYKNANNKLFFRQRDRCCENRIGHPGTIPHGASDVVHELVSAGCNTDLYAPGKFFDNKCDQVCKERVGEDTPVYRRDLGRCVPEQYKHIPNRTVCNDPTLRAKFSEEGGEDKCSTMCGKKELDQDRGYQRLFHHPRSKGEGGEALETVAEHKRKTLSECRALCDANPEGCDMFTISPCSTSSDKCLGICTLQRRETTGDDGAASDQAPAVAKPLSVSTKRVNPRTRVYAKHSGDALNDPHLKGFYERNNYCRMDGQPYYSYQFGADYEEIFQKPQRLANLKDAASQGLSIHTEPSPTPMSSNGPENQQILETFVSTPVQKVRPNKGSMQLEGSGQMLDIDHVYTTEPVSSFNTHGGQTYRMHVLGQQQPPAPFSIVTSGKIGWNSPIELQVVQQVDWKTLFAKVYQVPSVIVDMKPNQSSSPSREFLFTASMNVEAKNAQPTLDRLRENKKLRQTIQNTANAQLLQLSIPTTSVVVITDIYLQKNSEAAKTNTNVRVRSESANSLTNLQIADSFVRVVPKTPGVQNNLVQVDFGLPPMVQGKSMRIKVTFTIKASSSTLIAISCGWKHGYEYPMFQNLSQGAYTFMISSHSGEPLLELTKQGDLEPLAKAQLPKIEGQDDTEINHFQAFKDNEVLTKHLYTLFSHTDIRFKMMHFTGTDSISDLVIQAQ